MRVRHLAALAAAPWVVVAPVALLLGADPGTVVLVVPLGLVVAVLVALVVEQHRMLRRIARSVDKVATAPRPTPPAPAGKAAAPAGSSTPPPAARGDLKRMFRQVEALQNLHSMLPIEHALPASRGWPASPDLLLLLVDLVDRRRPRLVVECGSGLSTLFLALAMRRFDIDGRVVSLEHLEPYAEQTRELLTRHGVDDVAEVRFAPVEDYSFGPDTTPWYARAAWEPLEAVDLLFVDGPPSTLGPLARYPSVELLLDRMTPGGVIVLDDSARSGEQAVLDRWQHEHGGRFHLETVPLEKGAALLTLV